MASLEPLLVSLLTAFSQCLWDLTVMGHRNVTLHTEFSLPAFLSGALCR